MRVVSLVVALLLPLVLHAQQFSHPVMASRDDAFSSPAAPLAGPDTVRVLALMVQFQKDTDTRTTGDGQFDLTTPAVPVLDAPPHDAAYFRDHLLFLENYYRKASKGKQVVQTTLIDTVVTLPSLMAAYSPARGASSNAPVGNLARDSWRAADSLGLFTDFSAYDAFVVFHAGVGRDLDLAGQLGYDPTPLDIPSLYVGLNAFREFYGGDYQGIPVQGGAFHITNALVMPETETRSLPATTGGEVPYYLSINGLLCASLGNYLGLPDLFDTKTGATGIGRFGLMDGQAIFSFSGAFPPEPSAWEKYWLGWITPIVVPSGTSTLSLPAVALADSIYRVPISPVEYFLVENRNRDPFRTGQTVTSVYKGAVKQQTFPRDTAGFEAFDVSALTGVVTDVTSFDWSLPGALDPDGTWYDGGVLIWHIDEIVILENLRENAVNANPERRGVNLREADGSQDIGQSYGFLSAGSGSETGTPLDYWFQGNIAPVYKNAFSPSSFPSSKSNSGANSHVTISGFSARGPHMTAVVQLGDEVVAPLPGFPKSLGQALSAGPAVVVGSDPFPTIFVSTSGMKAPAAERVEDTLWTRPAELYAWTTNGTPSLNGGAASGVIAQTGLNESFRVGPVLADVNRDGEMDGVIPVAVGDGRQGRLMAFALRSVNPADTLADVLFDTELPQGIGPRLMVGDSLIAFADGLGVLSFARFDGSLIGDTSGRVPSVPAFVAGISQFKTSNGFVVSISDGTIRIFQQLPEGPVADYATKKFRQGIAGPVAVAEFKGELVLAFVTQDGYLFLTDGALNLMPGFPVNVGGTLQGPPALADMDGDGLRDIVLFNGSQIHVYSIAGVSLDRFPVTVQARRELASYPVVADMDGDGRADIVGVTYDGVVAAVDRDGKMVRGFPLAAGQGTQSVAAFRYAVRRQEPPLPTAPMTEIGLVVASSIDGSVSAWRTGGLSAAAGASATGWSAPWPQYQRDARHSGYDPAALAAGPVASQEFFPESRAYNWPNPVYDGVTRIRYFVKENATVRVKIFDLAGDLVTELSAPGVGGMDNEVEWNVGKVQSGVYFARIEATGAGRTGVAVVKVAVVK